MEIFLSTIHIFLMEEMPLALTVSMYSDLLDLRATGAGLVDMVLLSLLFIAARVSHALHVNSFFVRVVVTKISLRLSCQTQWVLLLRSMK